MVYTTGVSYSWISCFTFLLLVHKVSVQRIRVEGVIGQTVMLPCSITQKPAEVYWQYNGRSVCDIISGKADFDEQNPAYRGRVNISSSEIKKGNFSIMLSNVMKSDKGTYTCMSPGVHTVEVELTVTEGRKTTGSSGKRRADGLLTVLLACTLLYSLVF
ncbi:coxsackievirus and adenovirus receptor homolog isoform 1-T2 [Clarias gariepinus]